LLQAVLSKDITDPRERRDSIKKKVMEDAKNDIKESLIKNKRRKTG